MSLINISAGPNRYPSALAVSPCSKFLAFGSHSLLCIVNLESSVIIHSLRGPAGTITSISWPSQELIFCGDSSGSIYGFTFPIQVQSCTPSNPDSIILHQIYSTRDTAKSPAVSISALYLKDKNSFVLVGCHSSTCRVFSITFAQQDATTSTLTKRKKRKKTDSPKISLESEIKAKYEFKNSLIETCDLANFTESSNLLYIAVGTVEIDTFLFTLDIDTPLHKTSDTQSTPWNLSPLPVLSGHTDWVSCVAFNKSKKILATASHDCKILLWDLFPTTRSTPALLAVLEGHSKWIKRISWSPDETSLISSSLDHTCVLWKSVSPSNEWTADTRVGEMGGTLDEGFYSCVSCLDGNGIYAIDFHSRPLFWKFNIISKAWNPHFCPTGHFDKVTHAEWDPSGSFYASSSLDKTLRVYSNWVRPDIPINQQNLRNFYEVSRPQVHGYPINTFTFVGSKIFSGANEKPIRVFEPTNQFLKIFKNLNGYQWPLLEKTDVDFASLPNLHLGNRGLRKSSVVPDVGVHGVHYTFETPNIPLTDTQLWQHTLWPELEKLYSHANEIQSLAISLEKNLLASSCTTRSQYHATIRLWDPQSFLEIGARDSREQTEDGDSGSNQSKIVSNPNPNPNPIEIPQPQDETVKSNRLTGNLNAAQNENENTQNTQNINDSSKIYSAPIRLGSGPLGVATHLSVSERKDASGVQRVLDNWYQQHISHGSPGALSGHISTVRDMHFSPDSNYLLSVGKDRITNLYRFDWPIEQKHNTINLEQPESYSWLHDVISLPGDIPSKSPLLFGEGSKSLSYHTCPLILANSWKTHLKQINTCSWTFDSAFFATGSNDKKVKIYHLGSATDAGEYQQIQEIKMKSPVTCISFSIDNHNHLVIGLENGRLVVYSPTKTDPFSWERSLVVAKNYCHSDAVTSISWRPIIGDEASQGQFSPKLQQLPHPQFLTASADHSIRVFEFIQ